MARPGPTNEKSKGRVGKPYVVLLKKILRTIASQECLKIELKLQLKFYKYEKILLQLALCAASVSVDECL